MLTLSAAVHNALSKEAFSMLTTTTALLQEALLTTPQ